MSGEFGGLIHVWCHGLSFSNVCMRPEFMTSMSCDSVYTACLTLARLEAVADWWRSWPTTNGQTRLRGRVRASGGHFEHTLWLSICFLCTSWTLCFTPCLMQRVLFKVWNVMFSFSLGSVSTLFRWGGHFCHLCVKQFLLLTTVQKL